MLIFVLAVILDLTMFSLMIAGLHLGHEWSEFTFWTMLISMVVLCIPGLFKKRTLNGEVKLIIRENTRSPILAVWSISYDICFSFSLVLLGQPVAGLVWIVVMMLCHKRLKPLP